MTEGKVRALIESSARDAIFFRRVYPPPHDPNVTSFFGGLPRMRPEMEWPVQDIVLDYAFEPALAPVREAVKAPVASTFLGQIDCRDLPRTNDLDLLPQRGILYFFVASATLDFILPGKPGTGGRVLYWPESDGEFVEFEEPELLRPIHGTDSEYHWKWLKYTHSDAYPYPRSSPKWAVRPTVAKTHVPLSPFNDPYGKDRVANEAYHKLLRQLEAEQFRLAFGDPVEKNLSPWKDSSYQQWRGGAGFPFAWICIEIFAGMLVYRAQEEPNPDYRDAPAAGVVEEVARQARVWVERARQHGRFRAVDEAAKTEFWAWHESMACARPDSGNDPRYWIQDCLSEAYRLGPSWCLGESAEAARLVPASYIEDQRWQHCVHVKGDFATIQHRMLGATSDGPGPDYELLMQFDSDTGIDWKWCDAGVVQFWIKKSDLVALLFEDVIVLASGG